jgi:membrane-bound metal-dependent hydrolase YbcI (DUF457 family)
MVRFSLRAVFVFFIVASIFGAIARWSGPAAAVVGLVLGVGCGILATRITDAMALAFTGLSAILLGLAGVSAAGAVE